MAQSTGAPVLRLPQRTDLYYGGGWRQPEAQGRSATSNPATGETLAEVAEGSAGDMRAAIAAANVAFPAWRDTHPLERARALRRIAEVVRQHAEELAMLDAADCGNPYSAMIGDAAIASTQIDYFAGLVLEAKGDSVPMGPQALNATVREPLGVVGKILPFNHPFMFASAKSAAPLAAGNTVVIKPPEQAPLSALLFAELIEGILPPGVLNVVPGGREAGEALASDPGVAAISLIGSVPSGRAVARAAAETLKPTMLELGGKNALIAFADADPGAVAQAAMAGMNFAWCGQSCGSTSRLMLHEAVHDAVLDRLAEVARALCPGLPTDPETRMGAIVSAAQRDRVMDYIRSARDEGARLICGGGPPDDPALADGFFVAPTIFADVTPQMRIAREEIFGPVLAVMRWRDEAAMIAEVNAVPYGLTASIWTDDLNAAHRTARAVDVGYVWVNEVAKHFLGAPFGGVKQSGTGREECLEELIAYTRLKNIHVRFRPA